MKKKYSSPQVRSFTILPAQILATSVRVGAKENDAVQYNSNDIFWSKTFGGTIMDDVHSSSSDYSSSSDFGE